MCTPHKSVHHRFAIVALMLTKKIDDSAKVSVITVIPETVCTSYTSIHNGQIVHHIWLHLVTRAMIVGRCRYSCILNLFLTNTNSKKYTKTPTKKQILRLAPPWFQAHMLHAASSLWRWRSFEWHATPRHGFKVWYWANRQVGRYGKLLGEPPQNFEIHTTLHLKRSYQNTMPVSSYQICAKFRWITESHHRFLGEVDRGDLCFHWRKGTSKFPECEPTSLRGMQAARWPGTEISSSKGLKPESNIDQ